MNSKILFLLILTLLVKHNLKAQVGIGTTMPDESAILHLNHTKKGLLLTSIALTSSTDNVTIPSPATGLLIWNNGTGGLTPTGLYYWNGLQWMILSTGLSTTSSTGWNTNGTNIGSSAGASTTLSLGTSSYDDLIFKVNGALTGRLGTNNSVHFGVGTSASQSGTAIGHNAKSTNNESTALGANSTAAGFQSIALGYNSKTNSNSETAVGYNTTTNNQNSTALGSGASATGQNSTALGFGANVSQANAIVLGDSFANVGIGTNTPNTSVKVDVNGQYKLGEKGSIHKNQVSFEVWPSVSISNLQSGRTATIDIAIPTTLQINSTHATILVTPANDFAGNLKFGISNPRMTSTSNITINVTNISNGSEDLYSAHFYVTINEF